MMPAVIRGKEGGTKALLKGRESYGTPYTLKSVNYGQVTCEMRVVLRVSQRG
jgi:putative transposase